MVKEKSVFLPECPDVNYKIHNIRHIGNRRRDFPDFIEHFYISHVSFGFFNGRSHCDNLSGTA